MGGGVGCEDEKHITFDDRKKKRIRFYDGRGRRRGGGWCNQVVILENTKVSLKEKKTHMNVSIDPN